MLRRMIGVLIAIGLVMAGGVTFAPGVQAQQAGTCVNVLLNGDMESDAGWTFSAGSPASQYVTDAHAGARSLLAAPASGAAGAFSAGQSLSLPAGDGAELSFWYRLEVDPAAGDAGASVALLDGSDPPLELLSNVLAPSADWQQFTADVSEYAGRDLRLQFDNEDGSGVRLLIDDASLCVEGATPPEAAEGTPAPAAADSDRVIRLSELGATDVTLRGPFDTLSIQIGLPATWALLEGGRVRLDTTTFFPSATTPAGGSLEVWFNDVPLGIAALNSSGERSLAFPIPQAALTPNRSDGRHTLRVQLDSGLRCEPDQQTTVVVHATSRLVLPHQQIAPATDLTGLPRPIFQRSFLPDEAVLVVPDQPSAGELQAALAVAAGFGRMTSGRLALSLIPVGALTSSIRDGSHLIFVGGPGAFGLLADAPLPAPLGEQGFDAADAAPNDGIVQMAVSPWNNEKVVLVVSGNAEIGVIKAGQAVSAGVHPVGEQSNLALIAEVQPDALSAGEIGLDQTFADLGYAIETVSRIGVNAIEYRFEVPSGLIADREARLDLVFNHSALVDYERSGLVVRLNGEPIGSVRFSDESANAGQMTFNLPSSAVRAEVNRLTIDADLLPRATCIDPRSSGLWLTIRPESSLHLPLVPAPVKPPAALGLEEYPSPFDRDLVLSTTAFVLAANDPEGWSVAGQIAFDLGNRTVAALAGLTVVYADNVPEDVRQERDLLIVGRPSELPIIAELGQALPAPFEAGSDLATEQGTRVIYRLPPGTSVGYLELLEAPWNEKRAVLAVLGSTDQAVGLAASVLTSPRSRTQLAGNLAVITRDQIVSGDTRRGSSAGGLSATAVPGGVFEPGATATPFSTELETAEQPGVAGRPAWLTVLLGVSVLGLIGMTGAGIVIWRRRRSARPSAQPDASQPDTPSDEASH